RDAKRGRRPVDVQYDARQTVNAAVRESEALLNEFRQQMRTDLRSQAARGGLPESVIPQLRLELARVRASILERLTPR
ncbi:MAG TPA: PadR family transcriptional regulator, partial [Diaminobutyricibacter sp.]